MNEESATRSELLQEIAALRARVVESDARVEAFTSGLYVGVLIQGSASEMLFSNERARDLLGVTEEQLLGKTSFDPMWRVIHEDGSPFPSDTHPVVRSLITRQPVLGEVLGVDRPSRGDRVWLLVSAVPQFTEGGELKQVICTFTDITALKEAEQLVRALAATIVELATPFIPISDKVMVMPLVGKMDPARAERALETLLSGIAANATQVVIVDVTGVPAIDAEGALALLRASHAVRLLGAQMVLTGIRPKVAQTLISLGIDMSSVTTHSTLQSGIAHALRLR